MSYEASYSLRIVDFFTGEEYFSTTEKFESDDSIEAHDWLGGELTSAIFCYLGPWSVETDKAGGESDYMSIEAVNRSAKARYGARGELVDVEVFFDGLFS